MQVGAGQRVLSPWDLDWTCPGGVVVQRAASSGLVVGVERALVPAPVQRQRRQHAEGTSSSVHRPSPPHRPARSHPARRAPGVHRVCGARFRWPARAARRPACARHSFWMKTSLACPHSAGGVQSTHGAGGLSRRTRPNCGRRICGPRWHHDSGKGRPDGTRPARRLTPELPRPLARLIALRPRVLTADHDRPIDRPRRSLRLAAVPGADNCVRQPRIHRTDLSAELPGRLPLRAGAPGGVRHRHGRRLRADHSGPGPGERAFIRRAREQHWQLGRLLPWAYPPHRHGRPAAPRTGHRRAVPGKP